MNTYQKTAREFHEQFMRHWESNECFQQKCITSLNLCDETLVKLKALVLDKGFENPQDEIHFFKEVKPKILSLKFACRALMEYYLDKSIHQDKDLAELQLHYINKMQEKLDAFKDFRFYLFSSMRNRDEHYFTMSNMQNDFMLHLIAEVDKGFSTGYDVLLSYSKAIDFMKDHFDEDIPSRKEVVYPELQWTGNKTDLVELLASLHRTSVFNNGQNDFKRFAMSFSQMVNFDMKDVYRTVSAIKDRKKEKKSFINRMMNALNEMISDAHK